MCGDDLQTKHQVGLWIKQMGFQAYDVGKSEDARTMEGLTKLLINLNYSYHLNQPGVKFMELQRGMKILPDDDLFKKK
jgi:predicted dinucleotide-binding enzyme